MLEKLKDLFGKLDGVERLGDAGKPRQPLPASQSGVGASAVAGVESVVRGVASNVVNVGASVLRAAGARVGPVPGAALGVADRSRSAIAGSGGAELDRRNGPDESAR